MMQIPAIPSSRPSIDGRIGARDSKRGWGLYAWGCNLGDSEYAIARSSGAIVPGQTIQSLGAPRTYGLQATFDF